MSSYHGWTHAPKAAGGTDPIPMPQGTSSAYLDTFLFNGTGASVANDTWEDVVTGVDGTNTRWLDQSAVDPAGGWDVVFGDGRIENNDTVGHAFSAWGYVVFDVPDGTLIGAAINFVAGELQQNTTIAVDGLSRVMVYAERFPISTGIELQCYQASGGAADIIDARLHVRKFEAVEDIYTFTFAT